MKNEIENQIFNCQKELCKIWITHFTEKTIKFESRNSYTCKHTVERLFGTYITREAFEAAADELLYESRPDGSTSVNLTYKFTEKFNANYYGFSLNEAIELIIRIKIFLNKLRTKVEN